MRTLDDPAFGQEYEAAFSFGVFDHDKLEAVLFGSFGGSRTGIALVGKSHLDGFARHLLDSCSQFLDLSAFLFISRGHDAH